MRKLLTNLLVSGLCASLLFSSGCKNAQESIDFQNPLSTQSEKGHHLAVLNTVATTTMIADLVRQIGGHRVRVVSIMQPGGDPHVYKPLTRDADAIAKSDLVFINGLKLEHWVEDLVRNADAEDRMVTVTQNMASLVSPADAKVPDPHVWFDVRRWMTCIDVVQTALSEKDPEGKSVYQANADLYRKLLQDLDAWIKTQVAQIPPAKRKLVTSHDAFQYFGKAYGIDVLAIQGISTESEASARDLARIVEAIKQSGIKKLFIETSVNSGLIDQVSRETGATIGGTLYSDSTGTLDGSGGTYVGMVRDNVSQIVAGLR